MPVNPAEMDLASQLTQLEQGLAELKLEYEQYFMGMIKVEPQTQRKQIQAAILRMGNRPINNSALRFRFQQVRSRFNTFQNYWNRVMLQIESGKYSREEKRYELKKKQGPTKTGGQQAEATPTRPPDKAEQLYDAFIESRKQCGERTDNVSVERLSTFIKQQESQLRDRYGDRPIDFKVVIEDGRTKLRAILKK